MNARTLHYQLRMNQACDAKTLVFIAEAILKDEGYTYSHKCEVTGNRYWQSPASEEDHCIGVTPEGWME